MVIECNEDGRLVLPLANISSWKFQVGLFIALTLTVLSVRLFRAGELNSSFNDGVIFLTSNKIDDAEALFDDLASEGDIQGLFGRAWVAFEKGKYDQAGLWADYISQHSTGELKGSAQYLQAHLDLAVGMFQRARSRFRDSIGSFQKAGSKEGVKSASLGLASASIFADDPDTAVTILEGLDPTAIENDPFFWVLLSQACFEIGKEDLARSYIEKAIKIYSFMGDDNGLANSLAEKGWQEMRSGNYSLGENLTLEALELATTEKQKAYFETNYIISLKCSGTSYEEISEKLYDYSFQANDRLLERYINIAVESECVR